MNIEWKFVSRLRLLTSPLRLDARAHMKTEDAQRIEGYHTRIELEQQTELASAQIVSYRE